MRQVATSNATLSRIWRAAVKRRIRAVAAVLGTAAVAASSLPRDGPAWAAQAFPSALGLGVETVSLSGHEMTRDAEIFEALALGSAPTLLTLDIPSIRERIERLPCVASVEIESRFPNALYVRVSERRAFAVWRHGGEERLIDGAGHVLSRIAPGSARHLPRVAGAEAAAESARLFALLDRHPGLTGRLEAAERVARRRWTLHLSQGVVVHLPPDRAGIALDSLLGGDGFEWLLAQKDVVLDLRAPGRLAIRPQSATSIVEGS